MTRFRRTLCYAPRVRDLTMRDAPDLRPFQGDDCDRLTVQGSELHFVRGTIAIDVNNSAHVSGEQALGGPLCRQNHTVMFTNCSQGDLSCSG
jgi:hypothetical protein